MNTKNQELIKYIEVFEEKIKENKGKIENDVINTCEKNHNLTNSEIDRYSRQIIMPHVGTKGQLELRNASVLIIGAGGLGCPCALYLVGSGIGHIGILDYDLVELNNIHRQILHKEESIGITKVCSAASSLHSINSDCKISQFHTEINSCNALEIISNFDIVVDASDNVATRYLLNDACYFAKKPLVSGSALQMEGQLTVYHADEESPCYRCLFPVPPPPSAVTNCSDGGVLGVIPGTIGVLQALQVINILMKRKTLAGCLLLFDGDECSFRRVKLRKRNSQCLLCGETPTITKLIDYEQFCSAKANDKNPNLNLLQTKQRIYPADLAKLSNTPHLLVDVRSQEEFNICHIPNSVNIPIKMFKNNAFLDRLMESGIISSSNLPVYVICRRGNDSQKAVLAMTDKINADVRDIIGGLHGWAKEVDTNFPIY